MGASGSVVIGQVASLGEVRAIDAILLEPASNSIPVHSEPDGGARHIASLEAKRLGDLIFGRRLSCARRSNIARRRPGVRLERLRAQPDAGERVQILRLDRAPPLVERARHGAPRLADELAQIPGQRRIAHAMIIEW